MHTRSIAEFDRIAGPEAGEVAARYFADPTEAHFAEFLRVCVPLYTRNPISPDTIARTGDEHGVDRSLGPDGARSYDVREEAARVQCPTLVLAGDDDPSTTISGVDELVTALPAGLVRYEHFAETGHGVFRDRPEAIELVREFLTPPEPA